MNATVSFKAQKNRSQLVGGTALRSGLKNCISEKNVSNSYADMPLKGYCPVKKILSGQKRSNFQFYRCGQNVPTFLDKFFAQESDGVICFLRTTQKLQKKSYVKK